MILEKPLDAAPPVLEFEEFTVAYGDFVALDDFTTTVEGGAVGLLGPNGAGKSTLIRALLGLITPASGSARVMGLDIARHPIEIRRRLGYMPERDSTVPGANAVRTLTHLAQLNGLKFREARNRAHEALYYVGLGEARYRPITDYSAGMRQRAKLAAAIVHDPDLIVLDEPTNGLDPTGREHMLELIRDISRKGIHVLLATHLLPDVEKVCDRIVMINHGKIVGGGNLTDLLRATARVYHLRIKGDREAWDCELASRGYTSEDVKGRPAEGTFEIRVQPDGETSTRELFGLAARAECIVLSCVEERRRLEDIFIEAMGLKETH